MTIPLKDMKRTPSEQKTDEPSLISSSSEEFPFELRIHLDEDIIQKLGIEKLPAPGSDGKLMAKIRIESASISKDAKEGERRSLTLQITKMGIAEGTEGLEEEGELEGNGPPKPTTEEVLFTS